MIALVDCQSGNLMSVSKAIASLGGRIRRVTCGKDLSGVEGCILPGVGNFGEGMQHLREAGLEEPLKAFAASGKPLLGICLGMQMLFESSEEAPGVPGLGLLRGAAKHFDPQRGKVPHMGWNDVTFPRKGFLSNGLKDGTFFYFVHSYYVPAEEADPLAVCCYQVPFTAIVEKGTVCGTQFHPEKSQEAGLKILGNFLRRVQG